MALFDRNDTRIRCHGDKQNRTFECELFQRVDGDEVVLASLKADVDPTGEIFTSDLEGDRENLDKLRKAVPNLVKVKRNEHG